jgi:hypothetical protein
MRERLILVAALPRCVSVAPWCKDLVFWVRLPGYNSRVPPRPKTSDRGSGVFSEFRRRTGSWPTLSMTIYIGRIAVMIAAISILFWYGRSHPDNLSRTTLYFFLATLPLALASIVAETFAWNYDLRRMGLIAKGAIFPVRQMPPE